MKLLTSFLAIFTTASFALFAQPTLHLPKHSELTKLKVSQDGKNWSKVSTKKLVKRTLPLTAGTYKYTLKLSDSFSSFDGEFEALDLQPYYIHRAVTPDREYVYSWASASKPRSEGFNIEKKERFCQSLLSSKAVENAFNYCEELSKSGNSKATMILAEAHFNNKVEQADETKGMNLLLKAYEQGESEAGMRYYYKDPDSPKAKKIVTVLAKAGNSHAMLAESIELIYKKDKTDADTSLASKYSYVVAKEGFYRGLKNLSLIHYFKAIKEEVSPIEAAAWLRLYKLNTKEMGYNDERFTKAVDVELLDEDEVAVNRATMDLITEHFSDQYRITVSPQVFKKFGSRGQLSFMINNNFRVPYLKDNTLVIAPFLNTKHSLRLSVEIDEEYEDGIDFMLQDFDTTQLCLIYDEDEYSLKLVASNGNTLCDQSPPNSALFWENIENYEY